MSKALSVEERLAILEQIVADGTPAAPSGSAHHTWTCDGCGVLLGRVDPQTSVLRFKTGSGGVAHVMLGEGGALDLTCGACSHINTLSHAVVQDHVAPARD